MKTKIAAYIAAAVLMGFAVTMLPLALETAYPTSQYPEVPTSAYPNGEYTGDQRGLDNAFGLASQPPISSSSLILIVGLILAFAAYIIVKKQINAPPVFSYRYKPF